MKVILQHNVHKVGKAGDVVEAAPGFFRNFLEPRNLAVRASEGALKKLSEDIEAMRKKAEALHQQHMEVAEKINAVGALKMTAKAGESGKLYGKITNKEIAAALKQDAGVEIDKRGIKPIEEITVLGSHRVLIKIGTDVQTEISVEVAQEETAQHSAV